MICCYHHARVLYSTNVSDFLAHSISLLEGVEQVPFPVLHDPRVLLSPPAYVQV